MAESDKLIAEKIAIQSSLDDLLQSVEPALNTLTNLKAQEKAFHESWQSSQTDRSSLEMMLQDIKRKIDEFKRQLSDYDRKIARALANEALATKLEAQRASFNDRFLDAPWRAENRTDGLGALPHQIEGAIDLAIAKQGFCFDKRGLGKTLTSLIWTDLIEAKRIVVFAPGESLSGFRNQVLLWCPNRTPVVLSEMNKPERDITLLLTSAMDEFVLLVPLSAWRRDEDMIGLISNLQPDAIIIDEAHNINKTRLISYKGIYQLRFTANKCPLCDASTIKRVNHHSTYDLTCLSCGENALGISDKKYPLDWCSTKDILEMTGSPILNRPQELFPLLHIALPELFPDENEYLRAYCRQRFDNRWVFNYGAEEKLSELIGARVVMRDRESAGVTIPPQTVQEYNLDFDPVAYPHQAQVLRQINDYAQIILDEANEVSLNIPAVIALITRKRQAIVWPNGIVLKDPKTGEVLYRLNVDESIKVDKAVELIKEFIDEGERTVLFSQFKDVLHEIQRRLGDVAVVYDGNTPHYLRNRIKEDFDPITAPKRPKWKVALINYKVGGEALNLHAATQMVILDEEWNPGKVDQAYGRIDRMGQTQETTVHVIRVANSIDTWMKSLIDMKAEMIGGFESATKSLKKAIQDGDML